MCRLVKMLVLTVVPACLLGGFIAAGAGQDEAHGRLWSQRAARADAIVKLTERIGRLHLRPDEPIRNILAEPAVGRAITAFLSSLPEAGQARYAEDGSCRLTMEVPLKELSAVLKWITSQYYKAEDFKDEDFEELAVLNKTKALEAEGTAVPCQQFQEHKLIQARAAQPVELSKLEPDALKFWKSYCTEQGLLEAGASARRNALVRLAERIRVVDITPGMTVEEFLASSSQPNADMQKFLVGAREVGIRCHADALVVEAEVHMPLLTMYAALRSWARTYCKDDQDRIKRLEELIITSEDTVIKETGFGVPPAKHLKNITPAMKAAMDLASQTPLWATRSLRARGEAAAEKDEKMAPLLAEIDARCKLAEKLGRLKVASNISLQDFLGDNEDLQKAMLTFQQTAKISTEPENAAAMVAEIDLKPLWNMILFHTGGQEPSNRQE